MSPRTSFCLCLGSTARFQGLPLLLVRAIAMVGQLVVLWTSCSFMTATTTAPTHILCKVVMMLNRSPAGGWTPWATAVLASSVAACNLGTSRQRRLRTALLTRLCRRPPLRAGDIGGGQHAMPVTTASSGGDPSMSLQHCLYALEALLVELAVHVDAQYPAIKHRVSSNKRRSALQQL